MKGQGIHVASLDGHLVLFLLFEVATEMFVLDEGVDVVELFLQFLICGACNFSRVEAGHHILRQQVAENQMRKKV